MEQQAKEKNTYKFRLSSKDVESGLKLHVDDLASRRVLTDEIKTALTLLAQLKAGNRELLDSLFPNICAASQPPPSNSGDMEKRIADMVAKKLEGKLQQRPVSQDAGIPDGRAGGFPLMQPAMKPSAGTLDNGRVMSLPTFDDDDSEDTIVLNKSTGMMNGENAIAAMLKIAF